MRRSKMTSRGLSARANWQTLQCCPRIYLLCPKMRSRAPKSCTPSSAEKSPTINREIVSPAGTVGAVPIQDETEDEARPLGRNQIGEWPETGEVVETARRAVCTVHRVAGKPCQETQEVRLSCVRGVSTEGRGARNSTALSARATICTRARAPDSR